MARSHTVSAGQRVANTTPDGRVIIAREYNALSAHPHPQQRGRLVPTRGVNKLLVDPGDAGTEAEREVGVELYECDTCGKTAERAVSIVSHMPTHNPAKIAPDYDVKTLRTLVDVVNKYRKARVRGYCERAAEELNTLRIPRRDGVAWNPQNVSQLYNHWKDRPEVTQRRGTSRPTKSGDTEKQVTGAVASPRRRIVSPTSPQSPLHNITDGDHPVVQKLAELAAEIGDLSLRLARVTCELAALPIGEDTSVELREKAARYDQLAGLLRG